MARRRYQRGSLKLVGSSWIGRWREDIIGSDGRLRRIRRAQVLGRKSPDDLPTEKLAQRRFDLLLAKVNAPGYRPGRISTLAEFAACWQADVLSQRKASTIKAAKSHLRCSILPQLGIMRLDQLGKENVQRFVTNLSKTHVRKTVLNVLGTLSALLNTAKEWGYVCEGLNRRGLALPVEGERKRARFFSLAEARQIIAEAEEPFATMFAVAAMVGVGPGELCGLKVDDLDFPGRLIHIQRSAYYGKLQGTKTRNRIRTLPMPEPLAARLEFYLESWRPNPARLLFATNRNNPFSANNVVQRKLWPILDKLGIPRCGLHAFRHTHSSLLVGSGAPVTVAQAQLGHADPRITLGIYSHVIGDAHRQAVEQVAKLLDSPGLTQASISRTVQ